MPGGVPAIYVLCQPIARSIVTIAHDANLLRVAARRIPPENQVQLQNTMEACNKYGMTGPLIPERVSA